MTGKGVRVNSGPRLAREALLLDTVRASGRDSAEGWSFLTNRDLTRLTGTTFTRTLARDIRRLVDEGALERGFDPHTQDRLLRARV
ncbi:hypothetical protein ENKNEFLB_02085 [Nocardioides aquaticus]|uniref:Uncharacterized protein n=1 Tax=Nocardioides aquaticus TaxID=160826 RepID=A0ABX8EGP2_9ACTN|nr:hypothetical protein [Nocardioides aquaticus]QVT79695.1 hypothetical protein ENKNEFLB_02085 [Nocardioides aquaticus]